MVHYCRLVVYCAVSTGVLIGCGRPQPAPVNQQSPPTASAMTAVGATDSSAEQAEAERKKAVQAEADQMELERVAASYSLGNNLPGHPQILLSDYYDSGNFCAQAGDWVWTIEGNSRSAALHRRRILRIEELQNVARDEEGESSGRQLKFAEDINPCFVFKDIALSSGNIEIVELSTEGIRMLSTFTDATYTPWYDFRFHNEDYALELDTSPMQTKRTFAVYLRKSDQRQFLFIEYPECNCLFFGIHFIGDIDRDGKPDLILYSAPAYYAHETRLYLSSLATGNDLVRLSAMITYCAD